MARWMVSAIPGWWRLQSIEKFPGGQSNPTYQIDADNRRHVLRRQPFGDVLPSGHAVDQEFKPISALSPSGFLVPRPVAVSEDKGILGSMFYVMAMAEGRSFCILPADGPACIGGLDFEAEGSMTLDQVIARYRVGDGHDRLPDLPWYSAFNLFRMVGFLQGVKKLAEDGNASSGEEGIMITNIGPLAKEAWNQARMAGAH